MLTPMGGLSLSKGRRGIDGRLWDGNRKGEGETVVGMQNFKKLIINKITMKYYIALKW